MQVQPLRSYRAVLIPAETAPEEIEFKAEHGLLPTLRLKAATADQARAKAHHVSGRSVLSVERVEEARA